MAIFDGDAPIYDHWFEMKIGHYADKVETKVLFGMLGAKPGMHILDVGCGTGNMAIKLAEMGVQVTGIDASEEMLKIAREKAEKRGLSISFFQKDITEAGWKDHFDGVCSNTAFEFIECKEKAVEKMLEVVKPGGRVAVGTINRDSDWYDFYEEELKKEDSFFKIFKYASFITEKEMEKFCPSHFVRWKRVFSCHRISMKRMFRWKKTKRTGGQEREEATYAVFG